MTKQRKQVKIGRLELDLRGIPPGIAAAAAHALGPALGRALDASHLATAAPDRPVERLDTGRLATAAAPAPGTLATAIAGHVAAYLASAPKRGQS
ncbi:hypothetical protein [Massilia sp. METH4]|uniref:hypothetical protein n=1 Tax=Massilia sp. METH4 TaxID=3123041 RepID=UPI0030CFEF9B